MYECTPGICHGPLTPAYGKGSRQILVRGRLFESWIEAASLISRGVVVKH